MSTPTYLVTTQTTLLHPWDHERSDNPTTVSIETDKERITVAFPDFEGAEASFEMDQGKPRMLIYAPGVDTPISLRWTTSGFVIDTHDFVDDQGVVVFDPPA